ncbi:MAG: H-type lectin domain-containing protein [Myxococcales bacterium]|jgi:hypothetical protein
MNDLLPLKFLSATVTLGCNREGWNLLEVDSDQPRVFEEEVVFQTPFAVPPVVLAALAGFDLDHHTNARVRVRPIDITPTGFRIQITTWHDTRVWSVDVAWTALGSA